MALPEDKLASGIVDAFARMQSSNIGADGRLDYYGFSVDDLSDDYSTFDLVITFQTGECYCCYEYGCHFGYFDDSHTWEQFRKAMDENVRNCLPQLKIRKVRVVVEEGALFDTERKNYQPVSGMSYEMGPYHEPTS
jgi:hypothetical protein